MLHERHAARQVTAVGEEARERLGRLDDDQIGYMAERRRDGSRRARSARWRWRSRSAMAGDRRDRARPSLRRRCSMIASVRSAGVIARRSGAGATPCAARACTVAAARRRSVGCGRAANGRARRRPDRPRRLRRRRSPAGHVVDLRPADRCAAGFRRRDGRTAGSNRVHPARPRARCRCARRSCRSRSTAQRTNAKTVPGAKLTIAPPAVENRSLGDATEADPVLDALLEPGQLDVSEIVRADPSSSAVSRCARAHYASPSLSGNSRASRSRSMSATVSPR